MTMPIETRGLERIRKQRAADLWKNAGSLRSTMRNIEGLKQNRLADQSNSRILPAARRLAGFHDNDFAHLGWRGRWR